MPLSWKRCFPFKSELEVLFKCPRLNAALSQIYMDTDLSFEDSGIRMDQLDRKVELLLKRAWYVSALSLGLALVSTYVATNLDVWVGRLTRLLASCNPFLI